MAGRLLAETGDAMWWRLRYTEQTTSLGDKIVTILMVLFLPVAGFVVFEFAGAIIGRVSGALGICFDKNVSRTRPALPRCAKCRLGCL